MRERARETETETETETERDREAESSRRGQTAPFIASQAFLVEPRRNLLETALS